MKQTNKSVVDIERALKEGTTVGAQIAAHQAKGLDYEDDVREYSRAMEQDILKLLHNEVGKALKHAPYDTKDFFYVVLIINADRLLHEPKYQVIIRQSCPTPVYKQCVYKYHRVSGSLEYLWNIPGLHRYWHIVRNQISYLTGTDVGKKNMAKFVLLMESGELLKWVKKENGSLQDAVLTLNKKEEA